MSLHVYAALGCIKGLSRCPCALQARRRASKPYQAAGLLSPLLLTCADCMCDPAEVNLHCISANCGLSRAAFRRRTAGWRPAAARWSARPSCTSGWPPAARTTTRTCTTSTLCAKSPARTLRLRRGTPTARRGATPTMTGGCTVAVAAAAWLGTLRLTRLRPKVCADLWRSSPWSTWILALLYLCAQQSQYALAGSCKQVLAERLKDSAPAGAGSAVSPSLQRRVISHRSALQVCA